MKMNKFVSILTLGFAALTGSAAYVPGDGDIVDIRAVDSSAMKYGERNRLSGEVCSPENPLVAGETLCIRMRLQVRNAEDVAASGGAEKPLTWKFWDVANARWAADGVGPKLGIMVGSRIDWADFSATGLNFWEFSGELHRNDNGVETDEYCYYTDFYFTYTVKSGDIGLPIRLLDKNLTVASTEISTVEYALQGLNVGSAAYELCAWDGGSKGDAAVLCRTANGLMADWPDGPWSGTTFDGPILSYDLSQEGIYAKTVDFDFLNAEGGDWSEGQVWRRVTPGGWDKRCPNATVEIVGGAAASEDTTVYVWSSDESVFVPDGVTKTINIGTTENPTNREVMTVTIYKGQSSATFALKGAAGAKLTDTATLYMTSTKGIVSYDGAGTMSIVAMERPIGVAEAQPPTVKVRLNNLKDTTATVTADSDYKTAKAELWVIVEGETKQKTVVDLKATVGGSRNLNDLVKNNDIRLTAGGYDIMSELSRVEVEAGTGTRHATVYVYALGTEDDIRTDGIRFEPSIVTADPELEMDKTPAATLTIARQGEEGVKFTSANPADGSTVKATKTEEKTFRVKFADSYRNYTAPKTGAPYTYKGYTFKFFDDDTGDEYTFAEGVTPSAEGSWVTVKGKFNFPALTLGTHTLYLYGEAMDGSTTERLRFVVELTSSVKVAEASLFDPSAPTTVCEGDSVDVKLKLKSAYENGYIFLRPDTTEDAKRASSALFATGALVDSADNTEVVNPQLVTYLDGAERPGTPVVLRAFLGTNQTDPGAKVAGWEEGQLRLVVTNRPPVVKSLVVAGQTVQAKNAGKALEPVSSGIPKIFELTSVNDVKADWDTMDIRWVIDNEIIEKHGDPTNKANTVTYTFSESKAGRTVEIAVYVKDKDMSDYPDDANYYTTVNVLKKPHVTITTVGTVVADTFRESDPSTGTVQVRLSEPPDAPVEVKFTVSQPTSGYLKFQPVEGSVETNATPGEYVLKFPAAATYKELKVVKADGMDGTLVTENGINLNAEVTTLTLNADGVPWKDYYTKAEPLPVYVWNVPPTFKRPNDFEIANTNMNASLNTPYSVKLQAGDVEADLRDEWTHNGNVVSGVYFTVEVNDLPFTNGYLHASSVLPTITELGEVLVTFQEPGPQKVTISFEDKDCIGEPNECKIFFDVQAAKVLKLYPVGPASAASDAGKRYRSYPGVGAGRVFAGSAGDAGPQTIENFMHTYSFAGTRTDVDLWAFGYKADGKEDDGSLLPGPDRWITPAGSWSPAMTKPGPGGFYNYALDANNPGSSGYDSFMYGWIGPENAGGKGGDDSGEVKFQWDLEPSGYKPAKLPDGENNSDKDKVKTYPVQMWEAVFSREYLKSDNCGDINLDGIPDLVLFNYGLGVVDVATGEISGDEADKKNVSQYNDDKNENPRGYPGESTLGDFLPERAMSDNGFYGRFIPGLVDSWEEPFKAIDEIRGIGVTPAGDQPLNDAFAPEFPDGVANSLSFSQVNSDSYYLDPVLHPTSTLSRVEWLAWQDYAAAHGIADPSDPAGWRDGNGRLVWSPERPTSPTLVDTDGDGFPDGYEYYFWYRAHVGYLDGAGIHRYLTGRRYDPRNPGDGRLLTSEDIKRAMDPIVPSGTVEQDTDNDGLPDVLEMLIGTDPFDFDSDGDGLPDGWELVLVGLDPLNASTSGDGQSDTERNYDGDAMAFTTVKGEESVLPKPRFIQRYNTFAIADESGDTDGIQWYAETPKDDGTTAFAYTLEEDASYVGTVFEVDGVTYVTSDDAFAKTAGDLLAKSLTEGVFVVTNIADAAAALGVDASAATVGYVRLRPARVLAGAVVTSATPGTAYAVARIDVSGASADSCNAAWVYGRGSAIVGDYGMLALARHALPRANEPVAELPSRDRDVAYLHYLVYQQFGFDPRTAWNPKTPLAARWGETADNGGAYAATTSKKKGYAGEATRTRAYSAYDEFLLYSFFLNNGTDMSDYPVITDDAAALIVTWYAFTTNPRGPAEPEWVSDTHYSGWTAQGVVNENGADTDGDGVPDGWELYVMAGPKLEKKDLLGNVTARTFNFAPAYAGFTVAGEAVIEMPNSYFSPFVKAAHLAETDSPKYIGKDMQDGLGELEEFAGTDSCAYYAEVQDGNEVAYSTTIVRPESQAKWLNKFFPTDPWVPDTDDDGVKDGEEGKAFVYAETVPEDDKATTSFPGCGLNPCSVDTDQDGLPDGWEKQFTLEPAAAVVSTNAVEGLVNCMDGTVADAFTKPDGPNRDYDHDGLENWQEYMTGTMRCWRYDDPYTQWGSIPYEAYFAVNETTGAVQFSPDFRALGLADGDWDAFWYETLVHVGGPIYNPHLVLDQSPSGQYFSRVDVGWDPNYWDSAICQGNPDPLKGTGGTYYWFSHRIGRTPYAKAWSDFYGDAYKGGTYVSCSPINEDSDHDGMDDFYELFHGLNPLLGGDATPKVENPCDVVWASSGDLKTGPAWYNNNPWCSPWGMNPPMRPARPFCNNPDFDFVVHPWKNGLQTADADGDNELNYVESLLSKFLTGWGLHTDPSPMWMTDTSYSNALTRLHYRLPLSNYIVPFGETKVVDPNGEMVRGFTGPDGKRYFFRDFDAFDMTSEGETADQFKCDHWWGGGESQIDARNSELAFSGEDAWVGGWMFSFEENEGFDTDHDGLNDEEELSNHFRGATDPLDAESPRRRQAIYFPGRDAALQTPPEVIEAHPIVGTVYKTDPIFSQYTVECWVRPDEARNATIVERAIQNGGSNAGDRDLVRKNFLLGTRLGADGQCRWFTKFDSNGTGSRDEVAVLSTKSVEPGVWTHVAATYDGKRLLLYVNGQPSGAMPGSGDTAQLPECAVAEVIIGQSGSAAFADSGRLEYANSYAHVAIVVGASVKTYADFPGVAFTDQVCGFALNLYNGLGWNYYRDFFKGYVDEIRIWDGARSQTDIQAAMKVRFDAEMAKKNRNDVYDQWRMGVHRYEKNADGTDGVVPAELLYHFTFDALPSAENAGQLAVVPHGFDCGEKAWLSRPEGYEVTWWKRILEGYGSAYAGAADFVTWIPNMVARLPRFDGTTLDSAFWSDGFEGGEMKTCRFAHTAEPYPMWKQVMFGSEPGDQRSTLSRWYLANRVAAGTDFARMFDFVGRTALCEGADLLPLGGAFARYVDKMWDEQGASSMWEMTGADRDNDGLPDWWQEYAEQNYRDGLPAGEDIGWTTLIWYGDGEKKIQIPASVAYLRDLARGYYVNEAGVVVKDGTFRQTADEDRNGIPDWWEDMYGIRGEAGLADHDNDGLPNYVEYLLSEVFAFKNVMFSPTDPRSADDSTLDYFYRVGEVYVGEIFTDHDLVDDSWEDLYDDGYASRLAWDALADADEDGWSNRSENRYSKAVMPIIADQRTHYTAADGLVADYPIPTIALTLSYAGKRTTTIENAPIAVEISTREPFAKDPDAFYLVGAAETSSGDTGTSSDNKGSKDTASTETARTRTLGKWSNRHAIGTLTPGNIKQNSLSLEFCYDPSSVVYSWDVVIEHIDGWTEFVTKRGSRSEYDADKRTYGDANVKLLSTSSDYAELADLELRTDEGSSLATWIHTKSNMELGTVNLVTGEFDLNLGVLAGYYVTSGTNDAEYVSLEDQTFRIAYTANPSAGLPRKLYLGAADTGYVREGKNTVVAWADLNADGKWDVGEPYGMARDVDVSWRGTKVAIELTDASPVTPRIDLTGDESDCGKTVQNVYDEVLIDNRYPDYAKTWIGSNKIEFVPVTDATFRGQRIRVVRWLVNNYPVYAAGGIAPRVVFDRTIETDVRTVLTEADLLAGGNGFDLEWETLRNEVIANPGVEALCGNVRAVTYLVVVGDGLIGWSEYGDTNTVKALNSVVVRRFGEFWRRPTPVSPGVSEVAVVNAANPTFKWRLDDCPADEGYTAFRINVFDETGKTLIWDSGLRDAPTKANGAYAYEAPLYVGDKTLQDRVFENKKIYTWKVAMYNAKYSDLTEDGAFSAPGTFMLDVQTNGYSYGAANVAVRYFGPSKTWAGGKAKKTESVIRVRAYTSPDFTGVPVSAGYVTDAASVSNRAATVNCHVAGLPKGTYYLQAFVDANDNGVCEPWETQGYLCARDGSTADWLNPTAITFGEEVGAGDTAVIYLEDADTDGDGLPDGWEYVEYGSLTAQGVNLLSETKAGERLVNAALSGEMALQAGAQAPTAGLAGRVGNMLRTLASPAGVAAATGIDPADIEVSDGGLVVKSEVDPETLTIVGFAVDAAQNRVLLKVGAETTANVDAALANMLNIRVAKGSEVTVRIEHAASPAGPWQVLPGVGGTVTINRAGADVEVKLTGELPAQGFFRAKVEEK